MILPELLPVLAIHLYALGTAAVVAGILARNEWLKRAALVLTVLAFTTHTLLLLTTFMGDGFAGLSRSVYVQLLAWCITLSGLVAWLRWRYEALLLTVAPFSLLTFLIALLLRHAETPLPPVLSGMTFTIHIIAIFISNHCRIQKLCIMMNCIHFINVIGRSQNHFASFCQYHSL